MRYDIKPDAKSFDAGLRLAHFTPATCCGSAAVGLYHGWGYQSAEK
jgi:hypothetical protein